VNLDTLVRALGAEPQLSDWSARGVASRAAWLARRGDASTTGERTSLALSATVHRDTPAGRGSASFSLGPSDTPVDAIDAALMRAGDAVGQAWRSPAPAAPARVDLADPSLDSAAALAAAPAELAELVAASARAAGGELIDLVIEVERETISIVTRGGLEARWFATTVAIDAEVRRDGAGARIALRARRRDDLAPGIAIADALDIAARRARAQATPAGRLPVVMRAPALLHGGRGLLEAIVAQADPALERQGLVRYRPGQPIIPGAGATASPLTVTSDGTAPFGLRSAPLDDQGDAVRRFELVSRGVARDLALDAREAALRGVSPNGGARGLVVPQGSESEAALLDGGPLLLVDALAWLELAPITGRFRAEIALAQLIDRGERHDVSGGILRGDALAALALSLRTTEVTTTPEYLGPVMWHLGELAVD
jgi:predicted Zn-dependent protease